MNYELIQPWLFWFSIVFVIGMSCVFAWALAGLIRIWIHRRSRPAKDAADAFFKRLWIVILTGISPGLVGHEYLSQFHAIRLEGDHGVLVYCWPVRDVTFDRTELLDVLFVRNRHRNTGWLSITLPTGVRRSTAPVTNGQQIVDGLQAWQRDTR